MYTSHGHHIPNTTTAGHPGTVARCGGPGMCSQCSREVAQANGDEFKDAMGSPIMKFFVYDHLDGPLQGVSRPFCVLAQDIEETIPDGPEKTVCLRKLLEAKDAAVRAALDI